MPTLQNWMSICQPDNFDMPQSNFIHSVNWKYFFSLIFFIKVILLLDFCNYYRKRILINIGSCLPWSTICTSWAFWYGRIFSHWAILTRGWQNRSNIGIESSWNLQNINLRIIIYTMSYPAAQSEHEEEPGFY